MTLTISREQARRFLVAYHFQQSDLPGVFARLGTVQYDPLNPVGRNPDLVLQARIPGYRVNDWQQAAYTDRLIYDAWDKQAKCERMEKALADYREQLSRPFEYEERLRELLLQQQDINKRLDLDKGDVQTAAANDNTPQEEEVSDSFVSRLASERAKIRMAEPAG